jgi:hypothetical protein
MKTTLPEKKTTSKYIKTQYKEILNLNHSSNITIFEFRMIDEKTKGKNPSQNGTSQYQQNRRTHKTVAP